MTRKYHINAEGVPAPCRAKKGNCPFGGEKQHFDSLDDAQRYVDKVHAEAHGVLPEIEDAHRSEAYKDFIDRARQGDFFNIEREMRFHKAEDLEGIYNIIQDMRDENGDIGEFKKEYIAKSNANLMAKGQILNEARDKIRMENGYLEEDKIDREIIEILEEEIAEENEQNYRECPKCGKGRLTRKFGMYGDFLGCNTFPRCSHTEQIKDDRRRINKRKIERIEERIKKRAKEVEVQSEQVVLNNDEYIKLREERMRLDGTAAIIDYIERSDRNNRNNNIHNRYYRADKGRYGTQTPIEDYYEERKMYDDRIQKQIGDNELVWNSGQMSYGSMNPIEGEITTDESGKINNLYFEANSHLGKVKKVSEITDKGEIIFDDGERKLLSHYTNWRRRRRVTGPPQAWKFYTAKPSGNKYSGPKDIYIFEGDTSG